MDIGKLISDMLERGHSVTVLRCGNEFVVEVANQHGTLLWGYIAEDVTTAIVRSWEQSKQPRKE